MKKNGEEQFNNYYDNKDIPSQEKWDDIQYKKIPPSLHKLAKTDYQLKAISDCINIASDRYEYFDKLEYKREELLLKYFKSQTYREDRYLNRIDKKFDELIHLLEVVSTNQNIEIIKALQGYKGAVKTDKTIDELLDEDYPWFEMELENAGFSKPNIKKIFTYLKKVSKGNKSIGYSIKTDTGLNLPK